MRKFDIEIFLDAGAEEVHSYKTQLEANEAIEIFQRIFSDEYFYFTQQSSCTFKGVKKTSTHHQFVVVSHITNITVTETKEEKL